MDARLRPRWHGLCGRVGVFRTSEESDLTFDMLATLYAHPVRAYHNLGHVEQVLGAFDQVRRLADDADAVEMALWLHDCVYFGERPDNEERSADAAAMIAGLIGARPELVAKVRAGILATRHSKPPGPGDAALIADVDLTILGSSAPEYDAYRAAIRQEFAFAGDDQYIPGRTAFVQRMLDKPAIYATAWFKRELEIRARDNLYRELDDLERGRSSP